MYRFEESLEYGPNMCPEEECDCKHSYIRGYGYAHDEGCGDCLGHGVKTPLIHAVALSAPSEAVLIELDQKLREAEIPHRTICEPDAPWNGQVMAIGIEPTKDKAKLKPFLKKFKLCVSSSTVEQPGPSGVREKIGSTPSSRAMSEKTDFGGSGGSNPPSGTNCTGLDRRALLEKPADAQGDTSEEGVRFPRRTPGHKEAQNG